MGPISTGLPSKRQEPARQTAPAEMTLENAILKGLKQETAQLTRAAAGDHERDGCHQPEADSRPGCGGGAVRKAGLSSCPSSFNRAPTPPVPALSSSSSASPAGGTERVSKGKILLATVQGDIHDIGKNIVRVVLENYGYQVHRPGPGRAGADGGGRRHRAGRSSGGPVRPDDHHGGTPCAATIAALRKSGHPCKIMVGGAVLTPDYAEEIGADFYAKDAKASADIAKEVLG